MIELPSGVDNLWIGLLLAVIGFAIVLISLGLTKTSVKNWLRASAIYWLAVVVVIQDIL